MTPPHTYLPYNLGRVPMFSEPVCNQIAVRRQDNIKINQRRLDNLKKKQNKNCKNFSPNGIKQGQYRQHLHGQFFDLFKYNILIPSNILVKTSMTYQE